MENFGGGFAPNFQATTFGQGILEQHISYMTNLMWSEMFLDRQRWGWPCTATCGMYCWGSPWPTNDLFGAPGLISQYVNPRRVHWFNTHCITNTAKAIHESGNLLPQEAAKEG